MSKHLCAEESDSSEEYFDAEDLTGAATLNRSGKISKKSPKNVSEKPFQYPNNPVESAAITTLAQETATRDYETKNLEKIRAQREEVEKQIKALDDQQKQQQQQLHQPQAITSEEGDSIMHQHVQFDRVSVKNNQTTAKSDEFLEPKITGRQKFRDLRQTMQNDDDENIGNTLTPESQNSSAEGVYFASQRTTHPFRIVEHDTASIQSMTSLGRVGRILAGSLDPSAMSVGRDSASLISKSSSTQQMQQTLQVGSGNLTAASDKLEKDLNKMETLSTKTTESCESSTSSNHNRSALIDEPQTKIQFQEPDVIASTKLAHSKTAENFSRPVVPPRKKKKAKKLSNSSSENFNINEGLPLPPLDNTTSTVTNITTSSNSCPVSESINIIALPSMEAQQLVAEKSKLKLENLKDILIKDEILNQGNYDGKMTRQIGDVVVQTDESSVSPTDSTFETIQRELENTLANDVISGIGGGGATGSVNSKAYKSASLNRIYHSLGNSSTSINSRPSPSNSAKSNSAPSRVSSIDPNQGLNLAKATRGRYVVQPQDEETNKADGPTFDEIERTEILGDVKPRERVNLAGTGTNSLGSGSRYETITSLRAKYFKERRKSAGDEDNVKQMNLYVRTRTDSGKPLTDMEILQQVPVKNLDTGENFPLSVVEEKLPELKKKMNPLSFHIMRLTSEVPEMDEETADIPAEVPPADEEESEFEESSRLKRKTERIRKFFGSTMRKTVDKAKSIASEVSHARHKEDVADVVDVVNPEQNIKIKASNTNKGPYEFAKLQHVQDLSGEHTGAVWCMKFSSCGRLLATAGQDKLLRIWVLKDAYPYFQDMRAKYNTEKASPTPSQESLVSQSSSAEEAIAMATAAEKSIGPFMPKAFCTYTGHTSDLLDVSWSKNYFILSSSMDKTVRLWHISRKECLCCFQHIDFVTAIAFHPRDDRYFLSGSLDGKLRLWNIPDKKVALWNEVDGQTKLITAANFCQNGKFAVVGSYDGRCIFYTTDQLKYHTQIHVRSTRGRNSTGRKISGIEPMPGEDKILVTSNDSRIRLYDLRDLNLSCKYKGYLNASSQIKASFSHDGKYIIAGSENQCIYIWKTHHDYVKLSSVRRDRNDFWEGIKAHNATVTCSIFAPHPEAIIKADPDEMSSEDAQNYTPDPLVEQHKKGCGYVLVTADFNGAIKVFINKTKPKHSSLPYTAIMD